MLYELGSFIIKGNPVCLEPEFSYRLSCSLPSLRQLDDTPVTEIKKSFVDSPSDGEEVAEPKIFETIQVIDLIPKERSKDKLFRLLLYHQLGHSKYILCAMSRMATQQCNDLIRSQLN